MGEVFLVLLLHLFTGYTGYGSGGGGSGGGGGGGRLTGGGGGREVVGGRRGARGGRRGAVGSGIVGGVCGRGVLWVLAVLVVLSAMKGHGVILRRIASGDGVGAGVGGVLGAECSGGPSRGDPRGVEPHHLHHRLVVMLAGPSYPPFDQHLVVLLLLGAVVVLNAVTHRLPLQVTAYDHEVLWVQQVLLLEDLPLLLRPDVDVLVVLVLVYGLLNESVFVDVSLLPFPFLQKNWGDHSVSSHLLVLIL